MPEYLSPGVYVEEVDAGPKPIEGVSTSTTGAVGVTARGPDEGKPVLVTSFAEFQRKFGNVFEVAQGKRDDFAADPEGGEFWNFPLSVRGFFDNGGQRLYVKRVVSKNALPATTTLKMGVVSVVRADAPANATRLQLDHLINIQEGKEYDLVIAGALTKRRVKSYDPASGSVEFETAVAERVRAGRDYVVTVPLSAAQPISIDAYAKGKWGDDVRVRAGAMVAATLTLLADSNENEVRGEIQADSTERFKFTIDVKVGKAGNIKTGDTIEVGGARYTVGDNTTAAGLVTLPWWKKGMTVECVATGVNVKGVVSADSIDPKKFSMTATVGKPDDIKKDATILIDGRSFITAQDTTAAPAGEVTLLGPVIWSKGAKVECAAPVVKGTVDADSADPKKFKMTATTGHADAIKKGANITVAGTPFQTDIDTTATGDVTVVAPAVTTPVRWTKGTRVVRIRKAAAVGGSTLNVWGASALYPKAVIELDNGHNKDVLAVASVKGTTVALNGNTTVPLSEGDKVRLIEARVRATYGSGDAGIDETFDSLRLTDDRAQPASDYLPTRLRGSALIRVATSSGTIDISKLEDFPLGLDADLPPGWSKLSGGNDDLQGIDADAFIGVDNGPGKRTGIAALEEIDEISICTVPGIWAPSVHGALITHCELLKDRFAVIDPPRKTDDVEAIRTFRESIDTKYAAIYWPWIAVRDPFASLTVEVGPSAHMAGIYARVDVERGVHKAPANEVIRGIETGNGKHGLRLEITKREQDLLNPRGINALRFFPNRGTRVWGARTLSSDGSWKYINVRRLFIQVEESIDEGTQWVVFEPNDAPLWSRVTQSITNYLTTVWRSGALQGATADEAFFVKCDYTTMTQDDIDNGRLICVIGIAPVKPAEFVIFRIQQKTLDRQAS